MNVPRRNLGLRADFLPRRGTQFRFGDRYIVGDDNRLLTVSSPLVGASPARSRTKATFSRFGTAIAATALVISANALRPVGNSKFWIDASPERMRGTAFAELPRVRAGIRGSGFLVTDTHLVTALHVVDHGSLARAAFVFGYTADRLCAANGRLPQRYEFDAAAIFFGEELFTPQGVYAGDDLAIIRLDRSTGRKPLAIAAFDSLEPGQEVAMAGHARMQPMTLIADIDRVPPLPRVIRFDDSLIHCNIDAFQGNSGSALLDRSGDALGVHVDIDAEDYDDTTGLAARYDDDGSAAASAVRLRVVRDRLSEIGATVRASTSLEMPA
jgi:S1-C subfamily serine protease